MVQEVGWDNDYSASLELLRYEFNPLSRHVLKVSLQRYVIIQAREPKVARCDVCHITPLHTTCYRGSPTLTMLSPKGLPGLGGPRCPAAEHWVYIVLNTTYKDWMLT